MKDTELARSVGRRLRRARISHDLSISQACDRSGVGESTICRIENGRNRLAFPDVVRLARLYELSLDDLADHTPPEAATVTTVHVLSLLNPRALGLLGLG